MGMARRSGCGGSGQRSRAAKPVVRLCGGGSGVGLAGQGPFFFSGSRRVEGCCSRACVSLLGQHGRGAVSWCMFQDVVGCRPMVVCCALCVSGGGRRRVVVGFTSFGGWALRRGGGGYPSVRIGHFGEGRRRIVVGFTSLGGWSLRRCGGGSFRCV